jgi:hypothetical protein
MPCVEADEVAGVLASMAERVRSEHCPGCATAANRDPAAGHGSALWYDTRLEGWVTRVSLGPAASCILPLEISWYDAPAGWVRAAAAELIMG